jgi:hypothetical protein
MYSQRKFLGSCVLCPLSFASMVDTSLNGRCVQTLMILTMLNPFNITRDTIKKLRSDSMGRIGTATKRSITQRLCNLT